MKFLGKRPFKKHVRPIRNSDLTHKVIIVREQPTVAEEKQEEAVVEDKKEEQSEKAEETVNNEIEESNKDMDERLEKVEALVNAKAPKRKVKIEKKDKGIIERTENSTVLLTEDNKMMLTD